MLKFWLNCLAMSQKEDLQKLVVLLTFTEIDKKYTKKCPNDFLFRSFSYKQREAFSGA